MLNEILNFMNIYCGDVFAIIGSVVSIATTIVKITPTTKDDEILDKIIKIISIFSLVNTKKDQKILDSFK